MVYKFIKSTKRGHNFLRPGLELSKLKQGLEMDKFTIACKYNHESVDAADIISTKLDGLKWFDNISEMRMLHLEQLFGCTGFCVGDTQFSKRCRIAIALKDEPRNFNLVLARSNRGNGRTVSRLSFMYSTTGILDIREYFSDQSIFTADVIGYTTPLLKKLKAHCDLVTKLEDEANVRTAPIWSLAYIGDHSSPAMKEIIKSRKKTTVR